MKKEYKEAFAEVDEILQLMPLDISIKIPLRFKKIISENKAEYYKPNIKEPLEEQQLKHETKIILGLIYRDFLVTPEEKEELQAKDEEELRKIKEEMQQQYNVEDIFAKRKARKKALDEDASTAMTLYESPGFLRKLFNLIKGIFSKNKI